MPAVSERQRRYMAAEHSRAQRGEKTQTGMPAGKLHEFMSKPRGGFAGLKRKR